MKQRSLCEREERGGLVHRSRNIVGQRDRKSKHTKVQRRERLSQAMGDERDSTNVNSEFLDS